MNNVKAKATMPDSPKSNTKVCHRKHKYPNWNTESAKWIGNNITQIPYIKNKPFTESRTEQIRESLESESRRSGDVVLTFNNPNGPDCQGSELLMAMNDREREFSCHLYIAAPLYSSTIIYRSLLLFSFLKIIPKKIPKLET